jgi:hypothetical protein
MGQKSGTPSVRYPSWFSLVPLCRKKTVLPASIVFSITPLLTGYRLPVIQAASAPGYRHF